MAIARDREQDAHASRSAANESWAPTAGAPDAASVQPDQSEWPLIEAFRVGDKFVVQADVPGMQADDVVVELTETELLISGERVRDAHADGQASLQERAFGPFHRRVRLPEGLRPETMRVSVENGVLSVELERKGKSEGQNPQRVDVQRGSSN